MLDLLIVGAAAYAAYAALSAISHIARPFNMERQPSMGKQYDPQSNSELEDQAKRMAEFYYAHREKMGARGIDACLSRVAQENPGLYAHLNREWMELLQSEKRERRNLGGN